VLGMLPFAMLVSGFLHGCLECLGMAPDRNMGIGMLTRPDEAGSCKHGTRQG